ncbi:amino acid adenylation domain-containing protein [Amycolatopsis sp. QT-25]|uniref:non-ribosomal peptide synthetase n=1 Tax=Amycolatopsis sp. QT-25 TaxID=3034022 RepID=UPI0023EC9945|nr:non-ribosomal peptide synthetase [Amycolatopsis sp. QT-25]WET81661.1 amino acid adenylation domain-containing protein [Amycolatopsis sp. QT-25]
MSSSESGLTPRPAELGPGGGMRWSVSLGLEAHPFLADHALHGTPVLPGATVLNLAFAAAGVWAFADVEFHELLVVPQTGARELLLDSGDRGRLTLVGTGVSAVSYASLRILGTDFPPSPAEPPRQSVERCPRERSGARIYRDFAAAGNDYGPRFRWIDRLWTGEHEAVAALRAPVSIPSRTSESPAPELVDALVQVIGAAFSGHGQGFVLQGFEELRWHGPMPDRLWVHARCHETTTGTEILADARLLGDDGAVVLDVRGARLVATDTAPERKAAEPALTVAATFTAEPIQDAMEYWLDELGFAGGVEFAPFNQPLQQLVDSGSSFNTRAKGANLLLLRLDDWLHPDRGGREAGPTRGAAGLAGLSRTLLPNGIELADINEYETEYLFDEVFERDTYLRHGIEIGAGASVVDVGANIGMFSLYARRQAEGVRITAIEPAPAAFSALTTNAALYFPGQTLVNAAISDREGTGELIVYSGYSVFSGLYADPVTDRSAISAIVENRLADRGQGLSRFADDLIGDRLAVKRVPCRLRTLSSVLREHRIAHVDLLKIDAEGSEFAVLAGLSPADWKGIQQIVVEVHGGETAALAASLESHGYTVKVDEAETVRGSGLTMVYARRAGYRPAVGERHHEAGLRHSVTELISAVRDGAARSIPLIVAFCPSPPGLSRHHRALLAEAEQRIVRELAGCAGVILLDGAATAPAVPDWYDQRGERIGRMPYTATYLAQLSTMVGRALHADSARAPKVVVVDCDQTLWGGVCAEAGPDGVTLEAGHLALQRWLVDLHHAGVLLCLCSKNDEADVRSVFTARPQMPLRPEHFVATRLNWLPKSANLWSLAEELDLDVADFVFIDDSPVECAEVSANCPDVLALLLPEPERIPGFLDNVWAFDPVLDKPVTEVDRQRTRYYRENADRESRRKATPSLAEFLRTLELQVEIGPPAADELDRVAQLTERTTQFTLSSRPLRTGELMNPPWRCEVARARDRFGDYGLVGVLRWSVHGTVLKLDTFLLSCRALNKRVEHHLMAHLAKVAGTHGLDSVELSVVPTARNTPMLGFCREIGAPVGEDKDGSLRFRWTIGQLTEMVNRPIKGPERWPLPPAKAVRRTAPAGPVLNAAQIRRIALELAEPAALLEVLRRARARRPGNAGWYAPVRQGLEQRLAEMWSEVLGVDGLGRHDDFFSLGGTSVRAAALVSRLQQAFGEQVSLSTLLTTRTIAGQAAALGEPPHEPAGSPGAVPREPAVPYEIPKSVPFSSAQQRIWFLEQLYPDTALFVVPRGIRLSGELNTMILTRAIAEMVDRHPILAGIVAPDGRSQRYRDGDVTVTMVDLGDHRRPEDGLAEVVRGVCAPFRLLHEPPLRVVLARLEEHEHVLVVVLHHLVCDDRSLQVLFRELLDCYSALQSRASLPPFPKARFDDVVAAQREWLAGTEARRQSEYWKEQLAGAPVDKLPSDHRWPASPTFTACRSSSIVDARLRRTLTDLATRAGATPFMMFTLAAQLLSQRHLGMDDTVIGTPSSLRPAGFEDVVGPFMNILVLRTDLSGDPTVRQALARTRDTATAAYDNQRLPFDRVVELTAAERDDRDPHPLVEVMVNYLETPEPRRRLPGLEVKPHPLAEPAARAPLMFYIRPVGEGWRIELVGQREKFSPDRVEILLAQFVTVLEQFGAKPDQALGEISLAAAGPAEVLPAPGLPLPHRNFPTVPELVWTRAGQLPEQTAVRVGDLRWSYRELVTAADDVAATLGRAGVVRGETVAVAGDRGFALIACMLGVWRLGAILLPLGASHPVDRRRVMMQEGGARLLLWLGPEEVPAGLNDVPVLRLDSGAAPVAAGAAGQFPEPADPAYVYFTSGTSGTPRAVLGSHNGLSNFLCWFRDEFRLGPDDLAAHTTEPTFDVVLRELFAPLIGGGTLTVPDQAGSSPQRTVGWLIDEKVTVAHLVPTVASVWLESRPPGRTGTAMRVVFFAGEPLPDSVVRACRTVFPNAEIVNLYGPTETTLAKSFHRVPVEPRTGAQSAGVALPGSQILILGEGDRPAGVGEVGEIVIRSPYRTLGYRNDPEAQRSKFRPNPFRDDPDDVVYHTGDLGRVRHDGTLDVLGRIDDQLKIRGVRVEPAEVAALLKAHPRIAEAAVLNAGDGESSARLVAFVVAASETPTEDELLSRLRGTLPAAAVPEAVISLDRLPSTPNGKIDRSRLRAMVTETRPPAGHGSTKAPLPGMEAKLAASWEALLDVPGIGRSDSFFALGGHSLSAMQMLSTVVDEIGVTVPLPRFFADPTVSGLARLIADAGEQRAPTTIPRRKRETGE